MPSQGSDVVTALAARGRLFLPNCIFLAALFPCAAGVQLHQPLQALHLFVVFIKWIKHLAQRRMELIGGRC